MLKKMLLFWLLCLSSTAALMAQQRPDLILGVWESDAKDARMEIFKRGNVYEGRLLWGNRVVESDGKTSKKDLQNPDKQLRTRNILGIVHLTGLLFDGEQYVEGRIYDPTSGRTYDCKAWIEGDQLHLRGFFGFSAIGKTVTWHKH